MLLLAVGLAAVAIGLYAWYDDYRVKNDPLPWEWHSPEALAEHLRHGRTVVVVCDYYPPGIYDESYMDWPENVLNTELRYVVRTRCAVAMKALVRTARDHTELLEHVPSRKPASMVLIYRPDADRAPAVFHFDSQNAIGDWRQWTIMELTPE
jgi:hypothetical protein